MLTVTFAFVVATALFFLFRQTRWMGVVGVFVLLCISPLFFGGLLLLVGVAYYFLFRRRIFPIVPQRTTCYPTRREAYTKHLRAGDRVGCRRGARPRLLEADVREPGLANHRCCAFCASGRGARAAYTRRLAGGVQDPRDGGVRRHGRAHDPRGRYRGNDAEDPGAGRVPLPRRAGARVAGPEDRTACSRSWRRR